MVRSKKLFRKEEAGQDPAQYAPAAVCLGPAVVVVLPTSINAAEKCSVKLTAH